MCKSTFLKIHLSSFTLIYQIFAVWITWLMCAMTLVRHLDLHLCVIPFSYLGKKYTLLNPENQFQT